MLIENAGGAANAPPDAFVGSNGMAEAPDGSVWMVQHGARQIVRVGPDRTLTPMVSTFEGKRFNSPNDLVFGKDGALYFTDPPYGLAKQDDDPAKEMAFNGVYRFANGRVQALVRDLNRPNGLAFSPDFKVLYVNNSDAAKNLVMRYDVAADGTLANGRVLADLTSKIDGLADGLKVDAKGNLYTSRSRRHLGPVAGGQAPRHDRTAGGARQLRVGRRRQDAVHDGGDRRLPGQDAGRSLVIGRQAARRQPSPSVLMRSRLPTGRRHAARQGAVRDRATIGRPYLNSNGARSRRYRRQTRQWCAPSVSRKVCSMPTCSSA